MWKTRKQMNRSKIKQDANEILEDINMIIFLRYFNNALIEEVNKCQYIDTNYPVLSQTSYWQNWAPLETTYNAKAS